MVSELEELENQSRAVGYHPALVGRNLTIHT